VVQKNYFDDRRLERFDTQARDDFLEIHEERNGRRATIISNQPYLTAVPGDR